MCAGVKYTEPSSKKWKVYFPNLKTALSITKSDDSVVWIKWGRRKGEQAPLWKHMASASIPNIADSTTYITGKNNA